MTKKCKARGLSTLNLLVNSQDAEFQKKLHEKLSEQELDLLLHAAPVHWIEGAAFDTLGKVYQKVASLFFPNKPLPLPLLGALITKKELELKLIVLRGKTPFEIADETVALWNRTHELCQGRAEKISEQQVDFILDNGLSLDWLAPYTTGVLTALLEKTNLINLRVTLTKNPPTPEYRWKVKWD